MSSQNPVIEASSLAKSWSSGAGGFSLEVGSFAIHPGEFVAAVGPSGSGKSTFLDLLGLVLKPDQSSRFRFRARTGHALPLANIGSRQIARLRRSEIGYVLQSGGLLEFLSLRANIALPALLNGVTGVRRRVDELASKFGILGQLSKKPGKVSGGERQRAAIARALVHKPLLILADEPTAALDPPRAKALVAAFKELCAQEEIAVVMVTHQIDLVRGEADRMMEFRVDPPMQGRNSVARCH